MLRGGEVVVDGVEFAGARGAGGVRDGKAEEGGVCGKEAFDEGGFAGAGGAGEDDGAGGGGGVGGGHGWRAGEVVRESDVGFLKAARFGGFERRWTEERVPPEHMLWCRFFVPN